MVVDNRNSSYKTIASDNAKKREAAAKKKAEEQLQTNVNINPSNIVKSTVSGVSQVAVSGDTSSNVVYSNKSGSSSSGSNTTIDNSNPSTSPVSSIAPNNPLNIAQQQRDRTVTISGNLAQKLAREGSNPQSVRGDVNYTVVAGQRPKTQAKSFSLDKQAQANIVRKQTETSNTNLITGQKDNSRTQSNLENQQLALQRYENSVNKRAEAQTKMFDRIILDSPFRKTSEPLSVPEQILPRALQLPFSLVTSFPEQGVLAVRKTGLFFKTLAFGNKETKRLSKQELIRAGKETPKTVVQQFDPKTASGVINIATLPFAIAGAKSYSPFKKTNSNPSTVSKSVADLNKLSESELKIRVEADIAQAKAGITQAKYERSLFGNIKESVKINPEFISLAELNRQIPLFKAKLNLVDDASPSLLKVRVVDKTFNDPLLKIRYNPNAPDTPLFKIGAKFVDDTSPNVLKIKYDANAPDTPLFKIGAKFVDDTSPNVLKIKYDANAPDNSPRLLKLNLVPDKKQKPLVTINPEYISIAELNRRLPIAKVKIRYDREYEPYLKNIPEYKKYRQLGLAGGLLSATNVKVTDKKASQEFTDFLKGKVSKDKPLSNSEINLINKELTLFGERRLTKTNKRASQKNELSVELAVKPIEEIRIYGKKFNKNQVQSSTEYLIIKKGERELINPKDIPEYDNLLLSGEQRTRISNVINPERQNIVNPLIEEYGSGLLKITSKDTNLGSLSTERRSTSSVTKPVKEIISQKSFDDYIGLNGATINVNDFFGRIESLDLDNAKVFKRSTIGKSDVKDYSFTTQETFLNVLGIEKKKFGEVNPLNSFERITYQPKTKLQIEDQRFRIPYTEKKRLVARNIKSVTEYEGGFAVNVYTYDDFARVFRNVDIYIPKVGSTIPLSLQGFGSAGSNSVLEPENKKKTSKDKDVVLGKGESLVNVGGGQVQILKTLELPKIGLKTLTVQKSESKSKKKSKSKTKQESSSVSDAFTAASGEGGFSSQFGKVFFKNNQVYTPESQSFRVLSRKDFSRASAFPSLFSSSNSGSGSASSIIPSSKIASGLKFSAISGVDSSPKSGVTPSSITSSRMAIDLKTNVDLITKTDLNFSKSLRTDKNDIFKRDTSEKSNRIFIPVMAFPKPSSNNFFKVFSRKQGKDVLVGKAFSLGEGIKLGRGFTDKNASRSFKVFTKGGRQVDVGNVVGYYKRGKTQIEKSKYAINTTGEFNQITFKGLQAKRNLLLGGV